MLPEFVVSTGVLPGFVVSTGVLLGTSTVELKLAPEVASELIVSSDVALSAWQSTEAPRPGPLCTKQYLSSSSALT